MPIYEYRCEACGHVFEEWQKDYEERSCDCPDCKAQAQRIISNTAFILKGSGWYVTDYARGNGGANGSNGNGSNGGAKNGCTEGAKTDSAKSEAPKADSAPSGGTSASASSAGTGSPSTTSA